VLHEGVEFAAGQDEALEAIPAASAVFLLRPDAAGSEPYISKTANLRRRLRRLLGPASEHGRRLNLRDRVRRIEYTRTGSEFETGFLLYQVLRAEFPDRYAARLRLRGVPVIRLHLGNLYPRASVTTRLGRDLSLFYGPFSSRAVAEKFASDSLDFFKMRRCIDDLHPDPSFPGCVYSEMKMCLAPCFKGCSDEEYQLEVDRVRAYLDSGGGSLVREISRERDHASAELEFEAAASLHARLDKLKPVLSQLGEFVHRLDRFHAIIVQASALPDSVSLFRVDAGCIAGPVHFPIQPQEHAKSQSMESRVENVLSSLRAYQARNSTKAMEHLAILGRWYYRGRRAGEIFFADEKGEFPMRRVVRGVGRVYRGEHAEQGTDPDPGPAGPVGNPALGSEGIQRQ
jgi:excinuclease UvrABC nuclease subunit